MANMLTTKSLAKQGNVWKLEANDLIKSKARETGINKTRIGPDWTRPDHRPDQGPDQGPDHRPDHGPDHGSDCRSDHRLDHRKKYLKEMKKIQIQIQNFAEQITLE